MTQPPNTRDFIQGVRAAGFTGLVVATSPLRQHSVLMQGCGADEVQDKTTIGQWLPDMLTRSGLALA
jgi:hypothetical protein